MKKFINKFGFSVSALLPLVMLSGYSPLAAAEEADLKIYKCKQCVKYTGWRGNLDFGFSYVNNDSLRFGDYRGLEKEGLYAAVDGDAYYRDLQGRYIDIYARDLGYDSRQFDIRGGSRGSYEFRFGWNEIPKYRGYGTQTPFMGSGGDYLTLPEDWVKANTTVGMTALQGSLVPEALKTQREVLDVGFSLDFARSWSYNFDYQRQKKDGTRMLGAGMYFSNASILPAPVQYTTDIFDMDLTWAGKRSQVQLGFMSSKFDNGYSSLSWENPFNSAPQHSFFRAALEPGNKFYQFNLSGNYYFTPKISMSGQAAMGRLKQNEPFLPYTSNPVYGDLPLPRASLDAQLDTSTYNLSGKLYARLNNKLSFTARGKWDERDNKTPVDIYTPVVTDLVTIKPRYNRPYSYKRQLYSADLRYRAHRVIRLSGGVRQQNIDRTLQEVETSKETTWWGEAKLNPSYKAQFRVKLESANRDISDYLARDDGSPVDHPLMRKFNMADRERDRLLLEFDYMATEALGINLSFAQADANYDDSPLGLQESEDETWSFNVNYAFGKNVNAYAFYTHDDIEASMLNATSISATPWTANTRDKITTYGIGLSANISKKSSLGIDYVSSDSTGNISVQTDDLEDPFDPLETDLSNFRVHFDYDFNDRWGYKLYAEHEEYDSQDWGIDGLGVAGVKSILSMGELSPDYDVWYYRFQLSYRF
jgi:MtrB/PioB family decaheme-associated outer membrane protein